ncbi:hypothetical protein BWZ22_00075 [Seonamhaeicola sp. S2-3]|uniref:hypothetical protein n=1 Tax=Seonamhaeicola sp. S2-3 TaxID=1936081 RepID=UPI000972965C|nr:hypothetical protein [Seonamhaeicola sp. S2-3]APY09736.1 hypothetical protein BWZ22_00075 [Seonamhaeicola sp. S2-3]
MNKSKVLASLVIVIYILFTIFGFIGEQVVAFTLDALILPVIAIAYFVFYKNKTRYFSLFLIFYALSDLMGLIINLIPYSESSSLLYEIDYYVGNAMYVLSYTFLIIEICRSLNFLHVLKNYTIHIIVLTMLNIYLVYVLQVIVDPEKEMLKVGYYLELVYNIVMLLLLSVSLLNYFYRDNKKALFMFIGTLCLVFSEVIDVAYIYITQRNLLNFIATTLVVAAFYFFCKQIGYKNIKEEDLDDIYV